LTLNKKITTIGLILLMIIATVSLTTGGLLANAQPPPIMKATTAYCGLIPDAVGVNQEVLIHLGIMSTTAGTAFGWEGLTVTVTAPDGTTQTLGPFTTDSTGGTGTSFTPTQVGTYKFQTNFPEQPVPVPFFDFNMGLFFPPGSTFLASTSEIIELVVSEEPIERYPDLPLPTEFWSRPVDQQQRSWGSIAGNWLGVGRTEYLSSPYNDGPETAHVLWAKPYTAGGLAGGATGEHGMEDGDAYEGKWPTPVVMNGVLYYRRYGESIFGFPMNDHLGVVAVDLRTGEELWMKEGMDFDFGQLYYFDGHNYHGVYDYLWDVTGSTWDAYDPFTGDWEWGMTDVPDGIRYTGANGEFFILVTDFANGWMALWNQSALGLQEAAKDFFDPVWAQGSWGRNIKNKVINASMAYSWNVTIPTDLPVTVGLLNTLGPNLVDDRLVGMWLSDARDVLKIWALSLKPGQEGQVLYNTEWTPPVDWQTKRTVVRYQRATPYGPGGVFILLNKDERKYIGFSLDTGAYLWTTESEHYLQALSVQEVPIVDDKFYSSGVSGILYCYDVHTGERLWTYEAEDPYSEYLFGNNWWGHVLFVTDGKVYVGHYEHSPIDPKPRGSPLYCLDAETGEVIWRVDGLVHMNEWGGQATIADGIITTLDSYDQRIYAIGKGPSKTTVEAPKVGIQQGSSVVICGSVNDIAAGTASPEIAARFPNGVAAVSDASMSDWMLYVYKQFPFPANVMGVDVSLDVIDANGNFRNIGTATSDASGFYSMDWKPDIPGKYTVIATFAGSEAYYASYAEAAFVVDEAPEPTPPPEPTPAPQTDATLLGLGIGAILAIIVFGLLILLMLRKR
jgi:outer membrane protein assembly factor BamB